MPDNYDQKRDLLAKNHIVLWDYYESAIRPGSNDKDIRDPKPNDIIGFLADHPTIKIIGINGFSKYLKFGEKIKNSLEKSPEMSSIKVVRLPETSGGNANYGWGVLDNLVNEWRQILVQELW